MKVILLLLQLEDQGQVISNFPTPPSGGQTSRPIQGVNSYPYRVAPKIVNQGQGLGSGANPAGAGGGSGAAKFDDSCSAPKTKQS